MNDDILVDLGTEWGHVVPLSVLESINHIEILEDGHMQVSSNTTYYENNKNIFTFKSLKKIEDSKKEKERLLGFSSGLIHKDEVEQIVKSMENQIGTSFDTVFKELVYDASFLRHIWATHTGKPFFRFVLQYDNENEQVSVSENHNEEFEKVLQEWLDPKVLSSMEENERFLLFAYEIVSNMVEPLLSEQETNTFSNSDDIPVMGVRGISTQKVDLSKSDSEQIIINGDG